MKRKRLRQSAHTRQGTSAPKSKILKAEENRNIENISAVVKEEEGDEEIRLEGTVTHESIPVTFEFRDMRHEYSEGIRLLLRNIVFNSSMAYEAACIVTAQTSVGTVVCCEDENDVFAFATLIPIAVHVSQVNDLMYLNSILIIFFIKGNIISQVLREVKTSAEKLCASRSSSDTGHKFLDLFAGNAVESTGLMIHSRISNLPLQLVAPIHRNLWDDFQWARSIGDGLEPEEVRFFKTIHDVLLIAPCSCPPDDSDAVKDITNRSSILLDNFDDDIFAQESAAVMLYKPLHSSVHLVAMLVPIANLVKGIQQIGELL